MRIFRGGTHTLCLYLIMTPALQRITAFLCLLLVAGALYFHAREALWNDEIYTLEAFVFKGFGTVVTDYHVPNNHILANILYCVWIKITAAGELGELLDHPWLIRLAPAIFSTLTLWWVYRAGLQIGGSSTGWLSVLLLLSGVTFQTYAFQVRGYALSMTASAAVSALMLRWASGEPLKLLQYIGLTLAAAVLLYTLPSNLYYWAATLGGAAIAQALFVRSEGMKAVVLPAVALAGGVVLALICYQPVLGQLLGNEYFTTGASFRGEHFKKFGLVWAHFMSWRWLLLPLFFGGAYFAWRQGGAVRKQLVWLSAVLILPFLLSALRGDLPPERIYLTLLPVFSLAFAAVLHAVFGRMPALRRRVAYAALLLYSAFAYGFGVCQVRQYLRNGMDQTFHYYPGLNYNYYQHFYDPNAEYDLFREKFGSDNVLILESTEEHDMPVYLRHKKQTFLPLDSIGSYLSRRQTMYVSSDYAKAFMREMAKVKPAWRCRYLQNEARIPRIIICEPEGGR